MPLRLCRLCCRLTPSLLAVLWLMACSPGPLRVPEHPEKRQSPVALSRLGYTLQAGAFAKVENAARFSETLQSHGLDAAYYGSNDGLYRVCFGNFASLAKAQARGEALKAAGIIEAFRVVAPGQGASGASGANRTLPREERNLRTSLVDSAKSYLGVPYLFGGTREQGFDCSGLTWAAYRLNGLQLPRTSRAQFEAGNPVRLNEALPGDLVFFGTGGSSQVNHVGLLVAGTTFIHAPRPGHGIRLDDLNDPYFRKAFLGARSYL